MMNLNKISFIAVWILSLTLLLSCSEESKITVNEQQKPASPLKAPQQGSKNSAAQAPPKALASKGVTFNKEQVLKDYANTILTILDVSERDLNGKNVLSIMLSVPLDPALNHQEYFNVSYNTNSSVKKANKSGLVDGAWVLSDSGKTLSFSYTEPDTKYTVTIYQGLTAANGKKLNKTQRKNIKTRSLKQSINFDTKGAFLTKGLGNGIPVVTVNVAAVDINFYQVKEKQYQQFLQAMTRNYYWNMNNFTQYGDLVYSARFDLDAPKNTRTKRTIDIENIDTLKASGIYLAVMTKAGAYDEHQVMWFSVTDVGLHARFYQDQLSVFASSLTSGKALSQVEVSLLNTKGELLKQALTSPDGYASFEGQLKKAAVIVAKYQVDSQQHFSIIEINKPALDLSEFDIGLREHKAQSLFIYAPRDLYRPGELIEFSALLRNFDGKMTASSILKASITSPDGTVLKQWKWHVSQQGYYQKSWQIPSSAQVGDWRLSVENINKTLFSYDFKVEEFLPERLKLTFVDKDKATAKGEGKNNTAYPFVTDQNQNIKLPILGEYLYGAPASGNRLSTDVNISHWRSPVESLPNFEFGDIRQITFNERLSLDDITLDKQGVGSLVFKGDWQGSAYLTSPLRVQFVSSLYETGGRAVTRAKSTLVWPSQKMLGIRPSFGDKNPDANSRVSFDITLASLNGEKHAAKNVDIKLVREDRRYFWVYSDDQGWHYEWSDKEFVEQTTSLDIEAGNFGQVELPVSWGNYRLEVRDITQNLLSSYRFYAGWNWYADWENSQQGSGAARPDKIVIALDKAGYKAGDIAQVNIIPPEAGEALVMVEGDEPLWIKRVYIPAEGLKLAIPVDKTWQQHNLYISAIVLQPGDKTQALTPKRSFGLHHLPLDRDNRKLSIAFDVVEKALPEKSLPVVITVSKKAVSKDAQAKPANSKNTTNTTEQVFITLAAVDVGVLSISDFDTPDPFEHFFGQRRYGVDARDVYNQVIEVSQADKAKLRFGGDSDLTRGGKQPQSDVQIVSLFSGLVNVDQNGKAKIDLDIPDFNGRLRLMALAFSKDRFGSAEQEVTIASPVVTQIAMPRFLAKGDQTTIALDVTNLSGSQQQLELAFTASKEVTLLSNDQSNNQSKSQSSITLADGEKTTLRYQIKANALSGQARFSLALSGKQLAEDINRSWQLGLRPAYPAVLQQEIKILQQGEQLVIKKSQVSELIADTVQASITLSNQADIDLQHQLNQLIQYPYGCLEQTSSRAYPLIFATPEKQQSFHIKPVDESKRLAMINKGIERLASLQLSNGGYGLWSNNSEEEHWLTAYVADFLVNARAMGISVPEDMLSRTLTRLQRYLSRSGHFYNERWTQDANHYNFAYKAYSAYVLAKVNQVPLGTLRSLAKNGSKYAKSGLPQLHLAIALTKMGDPKRGQLLLNQALNNLPSKRAQYLGDYGSDVRDLALMVHLMVKEKIALEQGIALSFTLAQRLNVRQWLSTQERNALFLAGIALKDHQLTQDSQWSAKIILAAAQSDNASRQSETVETIVEQSGTYQSALTAQMISEGLTVSSTNKSPIMAKVNINGYSIKAPKAMENGLTISRYYLDLKGKQVSLDKIKVGTLYLVNLQVTAKERTPDAMVIDLLPAGFELENQNLAHSVQFDQLKISGKTISQWQDRNPIKHQEYRDDRYVAALTLYRRQSAQLFYLVRAVTPGTYQVPSPLIEDMYRPEIRAIGEAHKNITIM